MDKDSSRKPDNVTMTNAKGWSCSSRYRKRNSSTNNNSQSNNRTDFSSASKQAPSGKRALVCCISYKNTQKLELKGAIQDMMNMRDLLLHQFHFPLDSILILAEKEPYGAPTRKNIEDGLEWLIRGTQPGDSLVFYYSGHGLRQRDSHGDEIDGFDETICPLDFQTKGMIFDNNINKMIVKPLIKGVTLHAIVDSCHSGTVLDLPLLYNLKTGKWEDNCPQGNDGRKSTSGGMAICISACEDYQQPADTSGVLSEKGTSGAMTSTFIRAIKRGSVVSYKDILDHMHESFKEEIDDVGCVGVGARLRRVFRRNKIIQDPLLSSSEEFDINTEFKV